MSLIKILFRSENLEALRFSVNGREPQRAHFNFIDKYNLSYEFQSEENVIRVGVECRTNNEVDVYIEVRSTGSKKSKHLLFSKGIGEIRFIQFDVSGGKPEGKINFKGRDFSKSGKTRDLAHEEVIDASMDFVNASIRGEEEEEDEEEPDSDGEMDILKDESGKNIEVDVFYVTDRKRKGSLKKVNYCGKRGKVSYGICKVNIPVANKHVGITKIECVEKEHFYQRISEQSGASPKKDAFVFVHGFNVKFDQALMRASQIAYDIGFTGIPMVYSWPSKGRLANYISDGNNVMNSVPYLLQAIEDLYASGGIERIYLIAHSMGNRAMTDAVVKMQNIAFFENRRLDQIILAAPDIDAEIFMTQIAPHLPNRSNGRVTLYASSKDKALLLAKKLSDNYPRAGDAGNAIVCTNGIDTIDASEVDTDLMGHGYFAETMELLRDIHSLIITGVAPENRNLDFINEANKQFWRLK
jgi:esterase/lipase superfamily enzyme